MKTILTKQTTIALAMALFTFNSIAQKSFYAKLDGGYNWGTTSALYSPGNRNSNGTITSYEKVDLAFGKGINVGGSIGFNINKYFSTELNISYFKGGSVEVKNSDVSTSSSFSSTSNFSATMIRFIPSIVFTPGLEKINPYVRIGVIAGVSTLTIKQENSTTFMGSSDKTNQTRIMDGGVALGLQTAFGLSYKVNNKFSVFGELNIINLSYTPKKSEVTESTSNGVDNLASLTTKQKKTEFVDSYTEDSANSDPNTAEKELAPNLPFSSFGINVGVVYHF